MAGFPTSPRGWPGRRSGPLGVRIFAGLRRASRIAEPVTPGRFLHLGLLRDLQGVFDLDAKVSDRAFQPMDFRTY
jgi:hypothetical protein